MRLIYRTVKFFCASCGQLGYSAAVPVSHRVEAYQPAGCGHCGGATFRIEESEQAA